MRIIGWKNGHSRGQVGTVTFSPGCTQSITDVAQEAKSVDYKIVVQLLRSDTCVCLRKNSYTRARFNEAIGITRAGRGVANQRVEGTGKKN